MLQKQGLLNLVSRYRKAGVYFFILVLLGIGILGIVKHQAIYNQLYDWKLTPRPERLTELYFTNHTQLPKTYTVDEQQTVSFTVRNIEYRPTAYTYVISQVDKNGEQRQELATANFSLAQNQSKTIVVPVSLSDRGDRSQIIVTITYNGIVFGADTPSNETQSIHYWVTKEGN